MRPRCPTRLSSILRAAGRPWKDRPSRPLALTTLAVASAGAILPFTPLGPPLGFVPLPPLYFLFLAGTVVTYLALVEMVKSRVMRRVVGG